MRTQTVSKLAAAMLAFGAACLPVHAADVNTARFDKLKAMAGDWTRVGGDGSVAATYRVTAGGSAVVETLFPGTPHEMMTVYTIDRGDLVLTHYCAEGNQPRMKAVATGGTEAVEFKFDGGGNMRSPGDAHMHEASLTFVAPDHVKSTWTSYKDGKPGGTHAFDLVRKKS